MVVLLDVAGTECGGYMPGDVAGDVVLVVNDLQ